jgi:hypothetical protein
MDGGIAFALPFLLATQSFLSLGFFVGTGVMASLTGFNLLVSFFLAEVVALFAFVFFGRPSEHHEIRDRGRVGGELRRVCRRQFGLSYAAMAGCSSMA